MLADAGEPTILIDAPPLLPVSDAALLTSSSDGADVVVQSGKTRAEQLGVAVRKIQQVDGKLLGVVLNKVEKKDLGEATFGYGYGSYTSKYYRAEPDDRTKGRGERPRRVTDLGQEQWADEPAAVGPRRPVA
ncbi:hypothetical protein H5399_08145 [Tessaracoccus sp. MC1627]|nr:hypothetical protein [Tessaracoccus sp. MC1627]